MKSLDKKLSSYFLFVTAILMHFAELDLWKFAMACSIFLAVSACWRDEESK
jgi:hypothetical protein